MNTVFNGYSISVAIGEISDDITQVFCGTTTIPSCNHRALNPGEEVPKEVIAYSSKLHDEKNPVGIFEFEGVKYLLFHTL